MRGAKWTGVTAAGLIGLAGFARADLHQVPEPTGPLAGKTVVVSPGHGFMLDGTWWRYQRGVTHTLREDIHTNEIVIEHLARMLANAGARVESVRERSYQTHEVIVDDADAGFQASGAWVTATTTRPFRGASYRYAQVDPNGQATATFRPTLPEAGRYPVYVWFTPGANRARDARVEVRHAGGTSVLTLDQRPYGGSWLFLGEWYFERGTAGAVVLTNRGSDPATVVIADAVRFGGGVGPSGQPRWRESASAFLPHKGFSSTAGDVTIRPYYATALAGGDTTRWRDDFLYFALHTNAATGSATGLSTFSYSNGRTASWDSAGPAHYPTQPSPLQDVSDAFRDRLHAQVLADIRAGYDPAWNDRRTHRMNFGELREARNMPSALIELGFHDSADDAGKLADARFREVGARAIYKAILRQFSPNATVQPLAPTGLRLENLGGGRVRVRWTPRNDPLEASAAAQSYRVYVSADGRGFDDGVIVQGTSHELTGLSAGQTVFVRVAARNQGGESLPTRVGGARVGAPGGVLVVDGFQRAYRHTEVNIQRRFTYDYVVEHVAALETSIGDAAIDYAQNEAVAAGDVALRTYALVDWLLGRESSVDRTFDPGEQAAVEAYLQGGGRLFTSGTELGWDLEARGGGSRFLREVLGARYVADDAGTRAARGRAGGPWAALGPFAIGDDRSGAYDAASPDVLDAATGAEVVLSWENGAVAPAGVGVRGKTVVLGLPLEAVVDEAARAALASEAIAYLAPSFPAGGSTGGGSTGGGTTGGGTTGGSSTAPVGSTGQTAPGATAQQQVVGGRRKSGGCSLGPATGAPATDASGAVAGAALLLLLAARRRARRDGAAQA